MNRRGFVGILTGLVGALGLRGQEPTTSLSGNTAKGYVTVDAPWGPATPDGYGGCVSVRQDVLELKRVVCRDGEEYCPLGHSQKPTLGPVWETVPDERFPDGHIGKVQAATHTCSLCGVVYVPIPK